MAQYFLFVRLFPDFSAAFPFERFAHLADGDLPMARGTRVVGVTSTLPEVLGPAVTFPLLPVNYGNRA